MKSIRKLLKDAFLENEVLAQAEKEVARFLKTHPQCGSKRRRRMTALLNAGEARSLEAAYRATTNK